MKTLLLSSIICVGLLTIGGCAEASAPQVRTLESHLLTPPPGWVKAYGTSEKAALYYNIAALRAVSNRHTKAINQHARIINLNKIEVDELLRAAATNDRQPTTQPTTQPVVPSWLTD